MARPCYLKEICVFVDAVVGLQGHASAIGSGCLLCYARNAPPRVLVFYSEAKRRSLWRPTTPCALYSSLVSSTSARPAGADCWLLPARRAASAREPDSRSVRAGPLRRLLAVVLSRLPQSPSFFKWSRRPKFYDQQTHSRVSRVPGSAPARCRSRQLCEGGTVPAHILRVRKLRHREAK